MHTLFIFFSGVLIGIIMGQLSVWRSLRKKKNIKIDDWTYSARRRE